MCGALGLQLDSAPFHPPFWIPSLPCFLTRSPEHDPREAVGARMLAPAELEELIDTARVVGTPAGFKAAFAFGAR